MITNTGKSIMAKYLVGQAPSYASYIAIGCGATPLSTLTYSATTKAVVAGVATITIGTHDIVANDYVTVTGVGYGIDGVYQVSAVTGTTISYATSATAFSQEAIPSGTAFVTRNYSNKTELEFETFRTPIISRGYVIENGVGKIVLTAELPTEERYEITEIGLFSGESNPSAVTNFSRNLLSFTTQEAWSQIGSTTGSIVSYPKSDGTQMGDTSYNITATELLFSANADDNVLSGSARLARQERPRFYSNSIFLRGDSCTFTTSSGVLSEPTSGTYYGIKSETPIDLSTSSPTDQIRLAFSVIDKNVTGGSAPGAVNILVKLFDSNGKVAKISVIISSGVITNTNRYYVAKINKQDITLVDADFSFANIVKTAIYANVGGGTPSANHYVVLDAIRVENLNTYNAVYGMTGYSPIVNSSLPIVKDPYVSNLIEFRYSLDVT